MLTVRHVVALKFLNITLADEATQSLFFMTEMSGSAAVNDAHLVGR